MAGIVCTRGGFSGLLLLATVHSAIGQDLFLPTHDLRAPNGKLGLQVNVRSSPLSAISSGYAFTIQPASNLNLCLDVAQGHGSNRIQIWQCNGHENQLFFFDSGSYRIRWAGDGSKCIDAGEGMQAGTVLYLWDCNGAKQQTWGYDPKQQTIYLAQSLTQWSEDEASNVGSPLASLCMDLAGAKTDLGTAVQLWNCNDLWEQRFVLEPGITIRTLADVNLCLDLTGGSTADGTKVQMWQCNGHSNQKWIFDSWSIRPIADTSKCIDAGQDMKPGNPYVLWECNGSPQQNFGYDDNEKTIYLARSMTEAELGVESPMASKCLDISGGQLKGGPNVGIWYCNGCWNQQWQVIGPASQMFSAMPPIKRQTLAVNASAKKFLAYESKVSLEDGCPQRPGPAPTPAGGPSPSPYVLAHCDNDDQHNWPVFKEQSELQASPWGKYYQLVYGEIPEIGYPICVFGLFLLYKPLLAQAGVKLPAIDNDCPASDGTFFAKMSGFPAQDWGWISHAKVSHPSEYQLPANKWVEILHTAFSMDGGATWFYYTPGSGVFMWTGNTKAWHDHPDAVKELLNQPCKDPPKQLGANECQENFEDMYNAARKNGLDSLQFTKHADMQCETGGNKQGNMALEIVDLKGRGQYSCSQPNSGQSRFRAGWEGKSICVCDNTDQTINCAGFGMKNGR